VSLEVTYKVTRHELKGDSPNSTGPVNVERFLLPDVHVPVGGKPLELLRGKDMPKDQLAAARQLFDFVNGHMTYRKAGTGWGRGDAEWACISGYGNCSDFHSLFISLARSQHIPAKFEIGFPIPTRRGSGTIAGYHCWAKFRPSGRGWIPVDISEANNNPGLRDYCFGNISEDRIAFSTGRDLSLIPKQLGPPLNFFVEPYVEVGGKPWPADLLQLQCSYRDLPTYKKPMTPGPSRGDYSCL
jgi:transglutaminase-like putative cysteine protease